MTNSTDIQTADEDSFNLSRFLEAHEERFEQALSELRSGHKRTHWIWFIFPQFEGLSSSSTSRFYAIKSLDEAKAYLAHPVLGPRLVECAEAVMAIEGKTANEIFGDPDDLKVKSSATLFAHVSPAHSVFERLIGKFYNGESDAQTLELLEPSSEKKPTP